ncbi:hypothetical protein EHQ24_04515 [Leptospira noumeaensis]|uniref:Outer membrane protein beta-barrel domain-containing protein n=1 Tax=Leptospira noumeaensis TaxID=2484964 RepID=A0A4R9IF88_9LEPT|nr:hypothetical protein [Leptospira noumeaensis]TGK86868.1 hypothetical protein EHQ24_04515 [Leptospira noumeaensis]
MIKFRYIVLFSFLYFFTPLIAQGKGSNLSPKFGISISNFGVQRSIFSINSDKFLQEEDEIYGRSGIGEGISLSIMYFISNQNSILLRFHNLNNYNRTIRNPIFSPLFGFGEYIGEYKVYRPDIELIFRNFPFNNSFYVGPMIGSTGPRDVKYLKAFQINPFDIELPRGFSYNSSSRVYIGLDTGFMIDLNDSMFINIGYNIKVASNPGTKKHFELNYLYLESYGLDELLKEKILIESLRKDLDTIKQGAQALYFEIGIKF